MLFCGLLNEYYQSEHLLRVGHLAKDAGVDVTVRITRQQYAQKGKLAVLFLHYCELEFREYSLGVCLHWLHRFSLHYDERVANIARPELWLDTLHCLRLQALENEFSDHSG